MTRDERKKSSEAAREASANELPVAQDSAPPESAVARHQRNDTDGAERRKRQAKRDNELL